MDSNLGLLGDYGQASGASQSLQLGEKDGRIRSHSRAFTKYSGYVAMYFSNRVDMER